MEIRNFPIKPLINDPSLDLIQLYLYKISEIIQII